MSIEKVAELTGLEKEIVQKWKIILEALMEKMEFREVTAEEFRFFILNTDFHHYGVSDELIHKEFTYENGSEICIALRLLVGNEQCLVREDYLSYIAI